MQVAAVWGESVGIRPLRPTDAGALRRMMMDPEVADLLFEEKSGPLASPFAIALAILAGRLVGRTDWGIVRRDGTLIGSVRLWRISERNRSAMLTIFIGLKSEWGKGYGTEALRLVLHEAFSTLGLNRVELHVFDFNRRAIRSYEKVGFVREGVRRKALARPDGYHDILVMGLLRYEFYAREAERRRAEVGGGFARPGEDWPSR